MIIIDPSNGTDPIYGSVCNFLKDVIENPSKISKKQLEESRKLTDAIRRSIDLEEYDSDDDNDIDFEEDYD